MKTSKKIGIATKAVLCTLAGLLLLAIVAVAVTFPWSIFALNQLFSPAPLGQEPVSNFEYNETATSVEITDCTDRLNTTITVPALINGKTVTALGNRSFHQTEQVQKILLPDTLRVIDDSAFYRCYNLQSIEIPKKVRYIGSNPFFRCSSLQSITVQSDSEFFTAQDGILYDKNMTTLMAYPEGKTEEIYYLPETVTKLNSAAFGYHPKLKEIHLHENVTDGLDSMFTAFPEEITFYVKSGSAAETFAKEHANIQYKIEE